MEWAIKCSVKNTLKGPILLLVFGVEGAVSLRVLFTKTSCLKLKHQYKLKICPL